MNRSQRLLTVSLAIGLTSVAVFSAWLIQREARPREIGALPAFADRPKSGDLDEVRRRLYDLSERHKRISALKLRGMQESQISALAGLEKWTEDSAAGLGKTLRPEPPVPFKPEAFFSSYSSGMCRLQLKKWAVSADVVKYEFELSHLYPVIPDELVRDVRQGEVVAGLRLAFADSPTLPGKTYEETVRTTKRGKQIKKKRKTPDFRIVRLEFERQSNPPEKLLLEDAYTERDRLNAAQAGYALKGFVQWDIPVATVMMRDHAEGELRSFTGKEGSRFIFAGREYEIRAIRPDRIEVSLSGTDGENETWMLREPPLGTQ